MWRDLPGLEVSLSEEWDECMFHPPMIDDQASRSPGQLLII
jgi:hypothetical protein